MGVVFLGAYDLGKPRMRFVLRGLREIRIGRRERGPCIRAGRDNHD